MEIEELCRKLKPILGKKIDRLWSAYLTEDAKGKKEVEDILTLIHEKTFGLGYLNNKIVLIPPPKHVASGGYPLAKIIYNNKPLYDFSLREDDWIQHIGIFGRSGSGKTNVALVIISNLLHKKKPFLIFDWKRNYRDLLASEKIKDDILVFTVGRNIAPLSFNPLIPPPGTKPTTWLKKLIEIIAMSYFLGEGVMYLLQKAIDAVYKKAGVYKGNPDIFPTMKDVLEWLEDFPAKGRALEWMASTMRAVNAMCFGEIGRVINVQTQSNLQDLLTKNVILELDGLTRTDRIFLIQAFLLWIHHYRLQEGGREHFKHALIIEEAHNILLQRDKAAKETVMDTMLREIRELGESIILIDQMQSKITTTALANTGMSINMNQKNKADIMMAANSALLDRDEKDYLGKLPVGHAIIKLQQRWFEPFHVKFPLMRIRKGITTDSQVKDRMQRYFKVFQHNQPQTRQTSHKTGIPGSDRITDQEYNLLKHVSENSLQCLTEHYKALKLGRRKGNEAKAGLVETGFAEENKVNMSYGYKILLKLTAKGKKLLGMKEDNNGTSSEHKYWVDKAREYYESKGFKVKKGFKTFDLLISKGNHDAVVEIETGKSYPIKNIKDALKEGYTVVSAATNLKSFEEIKRKLHQEGLDNDKRVKLVLAPRAYNGKTNGVFEEWIGE